MTLNDNILECEQIAKEGIEWISYLGEQCKKKGLDLDKINEEYVKIIDKYEMQIQEQTHQPLYFLVQDDLKNYFQNVKFALDKARLEIKIKYSMK